MKTIMDNIKNKEFCNFYLLYGDEKYLVRYYKNQLKEALCDGDTMNVSVYDGKDVDLTELGDVVRSLPFFANRRVVVINDSGFFSSKSDKIMEIVEKAPETTFFIFTEDGVDRRNRLYKFVNSKGHAAEFKEQSFDKLKMWTFKQIKAGKRNILESDVEYFLNRTGSSMDILKNELDKLLSYTEGKDCISRADIDAICIVNIEDRIFDLVGAMASHDKSALMAVYSDLVALKEPPLKILAILGKQFAQLYAVRIMMNDRRSNREIAEKLGIRFYVEKTIKQASMYKQSELKHILEDCVKADGDIKSGIVDERYALELILFKYVS